MTLKPVMRSSAASLLRRAFRGAFTLVEMLVVIAIIGIVAAISVPALKNMQKSDAAAAATRQLLDDVARARQLAISQRSTVYMVFVPKNFWNDAAYNTLTPAEKGKAVNLLDKQLIGYNFVSLREVGEQPGRSRPKYLGEWRTLPEGMFIPEYKFTNRAVGVTTLDIRDTSGATPIDHYVNGFAVTNVIPFPTVNAQPSPSGYVWMPFLAFNHLGQLVSDLDEEVIPLARGKANPALDANRKPLYAPPTLEENPPGNSTSSAYNLVYVDRLTGRARIERQQVQ